MKKEPIEENKSSSKNDKAAEIFKHLTRLHILRKTIDRDIFQGLFSYSPKNEEFAKCLKESFVQKLREMQEIDGIDFTDPEDILIIFVLLYTSEGCYK